MNKQVKYQDPNLPIEERVKDLMARMTIEEKVRQLTSVMSMNWSEPAQMGLEGGIGCIPSMGGGRNPIEAV